MKMLIPSVRPAVGDRVLYDIEYCRKQIKRIESMMRYDTDPELKDELIYYQHEEKRLTKGERQWN